MIVPGRSSQWTEVVDQAPSPLVIAGYLARNGLSFQEADTNITLDPLVACTTIEGPEQSLEYYEERAEQGGPQLKFQDIESLPGNTLSPES